MKDLSTAESMHLHAADCWISVGNLDQAKRELADISPRSRNHPDVLQVRWHLCAHTRQWNPCVEIATTLTQVTPERQFGWLHLALSLRHLNRFQEAIRVLRQGIETCGESPAMLLSLACCHARLRSPSRAGKYLKRAFEMAEDQSIRNRLLLRAFDEPDLDPVWQVDQGNLSGYYRALPSRTG